MTFGTSGTRGDGRKIPGARLGRGGPRNWEDGVVAVQHAFDAGAAMRGFAGPEAAWRGEARCRGTAPDVFYTPGAEGPEADAARAFCRGCPVRVECLEFALATGELFGVWGGTTPRERRRLASSVVAARVAL